MVAINPGKRLSNSARREVLCISTPRRSLRIKPDFSSFWRVSAGAKRNREAHLILIFDKSSRGLGHFRCKSSIALTTMVATT
jgi:hypothetical protein